MVMLNITRIMQIGDYYVVVEVVEKFSFGCTLSTGDEEVDVECPRSRYKVGDRFILRGMELDEDIIFCLPQKYDGYRPIGTRLVPAGYTYVEGSSDFGHHIRKIKNTWKIYNARVCLGEAVADLSSMWSKGKPA